MYVQRVRTRASVGVESVRNVRCASAHGPCVIFANVASMSTCAINHCTEGLGDAGCVWPPWLGSGGGSVALGGIVRVTR